MDFNDLKIECKDCHQDFYFTAGEQHFYASKGFTNSPARCPACRLNRKLAASPGPISTTAQPSPSVELLPSPTDSSVGTGESGANSPIPLSSTTLPTIKAEASTPSPVTIIRCSECQRETSVPFVPQPQRPVYCRECYLQKQTLQLKLEFPNSTSSSGSSGNRLLADEDTPQPLPPSSSVSVLTNPTSTISNNESLTLPLPLHPDTCASSDQDLAQAEQIVSALLDLAPAHSTPLAEEEVREYPFGEISELELVKILLDQQHPAALRRKALATLAQKQTPLTRVTLMGLILALNDEDWQISWTTAEILGAVGTAEVGELLDFKLAKYSSQPSSNRSKENEQLFFILRQAKEAIFKREQAGQREHLTDSPVPSSPAPGPNQAAVGETLTITTTKAGH